MTSPKQAGFTAVELLITLFVAAVFLVGGYQLYFVIIRDSAQARAQANAANVAYDYLNRYSAQTTNPCTVTTPLNIATNQITVANLSNVYVGVVTSCPYPTLSNITKVTVTVTYTLFYNNTANPNQTLIYSTYVTQ